MYSKKKTLDKFYTKESVAIQCIKHLRLTDYDTVIESSAGNGVFSRNINHKNLIAMDIEPEGVDITKQDWFEFEPNNLGKVLVGFNPPFGLRNKLSKAFIEKAIPFAQTIAMILPNVYKKHTLQSVFPKGWRLKKIICLPDNSFTIDDEEYHVPCSFFIFDKSEGNNLMFNKDIYTTSDWEYSNKQDADWFVMGASPKTVKQLNEVSSNNRGYYIKATGISKEQLKINFENTYWDGNSSANGGVSWLTKPEIVKSYLGE